MSTNQDSYDLSSLHQLDHSRRYSRGNSSFDAIRLAKDISDQRRGVLISPVTATEISAARKGLEQTAKVLLPQYDAVIEIRSTRSTKTAPDCSDRIECLVLCPGLSGARLQAVDVFLEKNGFKLVKEDQ